MNDVWELYSKILSEQDLTLKYDRSAKTAYYIPSTKTVTIPTFSFFDDETTQALVSHEIAHAKFSTYSPDEMAELNREYGSLFNAVEDAYVERMIKKEFAGLNSIFKNGYKRLVKEEIFPVQKEELPAYNLVERLNIYAKLSHLFDVPFQGKENEFAYRLVSLNSNEEVVQLCKDIKDFLSSEAPKKLRNDEERKEKEEYSQREESDEESPSDEVGLSEEMDSMPLDIQESFADDVDSDEGEDSFSVEAEMIDNIQQSFQEKLEDYGEGRVHDIKKGNSLEFFEVDKIVPKSIFDLSTLKTAPLYMRSKFSGHTIAMVKSLAKYADSVFKQKKSAYELRESRNKETGNLDRKKLAKFRTSMQLFKSVQILPEGKSHGIVMCLDFSGSMKDRVGTVILQTAIVAEFCNMNKIPFDILGFGLEVEKRNVKQTANVVRVCNSATYSLPALLYWGEMKGYQRYEKSIFHMTNTPTTEILTVASESIRDMKMAGIEKTCLFLITDGFHDVTIGLGKNLYIGDIGKILWKGKFTDASNYIKDFLHSDWIIELLCADIKERYGTFVSITSLSNLNLMLNEYSENLRIGLGVDAHSYISTQLSSDEYFYGLKHAHYFPVPNLAKLLKESKNLFVVNFKKNPFLDQFQNLDLDTIVKEGSQQDLTKKMEYYKMLKLFVGNFISEIA